MKPGETIFPVASIVSPVNSILSAIWARRFPSRRMSLTGKDTDLSALKVRTRPPLMRRDIIVKDALTEIVGQCGIYIFAGSLQTDPSDPNVGVEMVRRVTGSGSPVLPFWRDDPAFITL